MAVSRLKRWWIRVRIFFAMIAILLSLGVGIAASAWILQREIKQANLRAAEAERIARDTAEAAGTHGLASTTEPTPIPTSQPGEFLYPYELKVQALEFLGRRRTERSVTARLTFVFDCPSELCKQRLEASRSQLKDALLEISRTLSASEAKDPGIVVRLKAKMLERAKADFGDMAPHGIAVRDFVIF